MAMPPILSQFHYFHSEASKVPGDGQNCSTSCDVNYEQQRELLEQLPLHTDPQLACKEAMCL